MRCPNDECKRSSKIVKNSDSNFDYCKECGTVVYRQKDKR